MTSTPLGNRHPQMLDDPRPAVPAEGQVEAFEFAVGTFWGPRRVRLVMYADGTWIAHLFGDDPHDFFASREQPTAEAAVNALCRRLAV